MHPAQRGASGGVLEVGVGCGVRPAHAERCPGFSAGRILTRKGASPGLGGRPRPSRLHAGAARKRLRRRDESPQRRSAGRDQGVARGARRTRRSVVRPPSLPFFARPAGRAGTDRAPRSPSGHPRAAWTTPPCLGPLRPRERRCTPFAAGSARISIASRASPGHSRSGRKRHESHRRSVSPLPRDRRRSRRNPKFQVDAAWPKPLPNGWIMGQAAGVAVDAQDHIWVVQRPKTLTDDEKAATLNPPRTQVLQAGPAGARVRRRGQSRPGLGRPGPGLRLARRTSTASTSTTRASSGSPATASSDGHILKFTRDGKFVLQIGKPGPQTSSTDTTRLGRPADMVVDPAANEVYVADGYGNRRVIVFDADTGAYKRHWGAYGKPPTDDKTAALRPGRAAPQQFGEPGALRAHRAATASSTSATARTTASRCSARTAPS